MDICIAKTHRIHLHEAHCGLPQLYRCTCTLCHIILPRMLGSVQKRRKPGESREN